MLSKRSIHKLLIVGALCSSVMLNAQDTKKPIAYDAEKIADVFYALSGDPKDPHKKINHAKGFCALGSFMPAKDITQKIDLPLLGEQNIPVQVRYSLGGGNRNASDKSKPRGMALKLGGKSDSWEIVMLNTEINFAKNPQEFGEFFAMRVPKNGKVDTDYIAKKTQEVESYKNFDNYLKGIGITGSVANTAYYSIHTFYFKDAKSKKFVPARFKFVPTQGVSYLSEEALKKSGDNFLESDFKSKSAKAPISYKMILVFANPQDSLDTTALWSGQHKELEVGELQVSKYDGVGCNGDVFMPIILPSGVEAPKDPLFQTRNDTYGITFGRRQ